MKLGKEDVAVGGLVLNSTKDLRVFFIAVPIGSELTGLTWNDTKYKKKTTSVRFILSVDW